MQNVIIKIAFSSSPELMFESKTLPDCLIDTFEFNLGDFDSLESLNKAIEEKAKQCIDKFNSPVCKHYIDVIPYPSAKGFYPTGGVRWTEKAWDFQQYINNKGSADTHKIGDRVTLKNMYGHTISTRIFGFDNDGDAILEWDCYWVSVPLERLHIETIV